MSLITIPDKNTNDTLTAAEFNQILDAIKDGVKEINASGIQISGATKTFAEVDGAQTFTELQNFTVNVTSLSDGDTGVCNKFTGLNAGVDFSANSVGEINVLVNASGTVEPAENSNQSEWSIGTNGNTPTSGNAITVNLHELYVIERNDAVFSGFSVGDKLYVDSDGGYTATIPSGARVEHVATVVYANTVLKTSKLPYGTS